MNRQPVARVLALVSAFVVALALAQPASAVVDDAVPSNGWRPSGGIAYSVARVGDMIVMGGTFTGMVSPTGATATRNRLAAISATTGELLPWNPSADGTVFTVTGSPDGATVFVGGAFATIGGAGRTGLAALSAATGAVEPFAPVLNGTVRALVVDGGSLFVGGTFWQANRLNRGGGAEFDLATGGLLAWNPQTNYGVYAIEPTASAVWVAGPFTMAGGASREFVAQVARGTGALLPWVSGATCRDAMNRCVVFDVIDAGDTVYLAQGGPGGRVTALNTATGAQRWWSGGDGDCQTIVLAGDKIYAGGHWTDAFAGVPRAGVVALNRFTGAVLPELDTAVLGGSGVWTLLRDGERLWLSGQYTTIGGAAIGKLSSFPILPDPPDDVPPAQPTTLRAPAVLNGQVSLSWAAAGDNVATIAYEVLRGTAVVGTTATTRFKDTAVEADTSYSYTVRAVDSSGNRGAPSTAVSVRTPAPSTALVPLGASWQYSSNGSLPGADWMQPGANPAGWASGTGEFGYGDGDETTYISPLGVAHYFRTEFEVADPATAVSPTLWLLTDDGAVVYLNGTELLRQGMPAGTIDNSTLATATIGGNAEMAYTGYPVPASALVAGRNVLAVEVHNQSTTSSDISFDAVLTTAAAPAPPSAPTGLAASPTAGSVALTWSPAVGATSYQVLRDDAPLATTTAPSFTDTTVAPSTTYSYRVVASNAAGAGPASDALSVTTPAAPQPPATPTGLAVTASTSTSLSLSWDAVDGATSYLVTRDGTALPEVAAAAFTDTGLSPGTSYTYTVAARNAAGLSGPGDPVSGTTSTQPISSYLTSGAVWRFNDSGADLGTAWTAPTYDDSAWKSGPTQLGYGDGDEQTLLSWGSRPNGKPITNYARATFFAGSDVSDVASLALRAIVDDGAVVYLNGTEVWRFNLPAGTITSATRASTAIAGNAESTWRTAGIPATALRPGWNTVAVEVHQDAPSSSDVSLDLALSPVR